MKCFRFGILLGCALVGAAAFGAKKPAKPQKTPEQIAAEKAEREQRSADSRRMSELAAKMKDANGEYSIMYGRYAEVEPVFDEYWKLAKKYKRPVEFRFAYQQWGFAPLAVGRNCKWALHKYDDLRDICETGIEFSKSLKGDRAFSPADVYELKLSAAMAPLKGSPELVAAELAKIEPPLAEGLKVADRLDRLQKCASVASAANDEHLVRGVELYLKTVSPQAEKRTCTIGWSDTPIDGVAAWKGLDDKGELMDRNYGGFKEVFVTDVASGDRGASTDASATRPTMWAVCDDWGVHFKFADPDEKAREMYLGSVRAGTYELYIAPGADEPYTMVNFPAKDSGRTSAMNTAYDHAGYRRIDVNDRSLYRSMTSFDGKALITTVSFSWSNWADKVPTADSVWDFEVVRWGRTGNSAWNGLRRVHGRSTWGHLRFDLPKSARAQILRRQVLTAAATYKSEKSAYSFGRGGIIDKWGDRAMGDPAFFAAEVKPLVEELDGYLAEATPDMDDDKVLELAEKALPKWRDLRYIISAKRADYLRRTLAQGFAPVRPHPRLLADKDEFAAIKARLETDPDAKRAVERLLKEAESFADLPALCRELEGRRLLTISRNAIERILKCAFAWRYTGKAAYLATAKREALALAGFKDWNPSHFLDTAEATFAMGIAYDWLYEGLSESERKTIADAIIAKGLSTGDGKTLPSGFWVNGANNWNQVCNGGLSAGAAAVREVAPDLAAATLKRARKGLPYAMKAFAGGGFPEGPAGYWGYAMEYNAIVLSVLEKEFADGVPELFETEGFAEQADYPDLMTGPTGSFFNFSDAGATSIVKRHTQMPVWYLAKRLNRPDILSAHEFGCFLARLDENPSVGRSYRSFDRFMPLTLLWFQRPQPAAPAKSAVRLGGKNPVAVLRCGEGKDAWYAGIKGGRASVSHGHVDVGSFVLDALGSRWVCDLGCENYNRIEQMKTIDLWKMGQNSSRWSLFRLNAEGHGVPQFDGKLPDVGETAVFQSVGDKPQPKAVLDLSPVYAADCTRYWRTCTLATNGVFSVEDQVNGAKPGAKLTWKFMTPAKASVTNAVLVLEQDGGQLRVEGPEGAEWRVDDLSKPATPADSPNPGFMKVSFVQTIPESGNLKFMVKFLR